MGSAWHHSFLAGRPGPVDRTIVVPPVPGVNAPPDAAVDTAAIERFFVQLRRERFDLALQLHGGGRYSNPFVRQLGARLSVGLQSADAEPLDRCIPYLFYQLEVLRYLEVVSLVGARPLRLAPHLPVTERDRAEANALLPQTERPLAVLHVGAGDPRRRWPAENFARVADELAEQGAALVLTGTAEDRPLVERVRDRMRHEVLDACDRLSLGGLVGLLARATVVVGNDSGPLHLAAAVGAATVGLYWCGNLITAGPLTRLRHRPVVSWQVECPVCGVNVTRDQCDHRPSFVSDIRVEEVTGNALALIESQQAIRESSQRSSNQLPFESRAS